MRSGTAKESSSFQVEPVVMSMLFDDSFFGCMTILLV